MIKAILTKQLPVVIILLVLSTRAFAQDFQVIQNQDVRILFDPLLKIKAEEIAAGYSEIKASLEKSIGWNLLGRPTVLLIKDDKLFYRIAPHPLAVAFADPGSQTIVMHYSRMSGTPFGMANTLKHELCHLLLHQHIKGHLLPRWLDEGVCQWSSDWTGDIIMDRSRSLLNSAAIKRTFIPLNRLEGAFPDENDAFILAYEQSKDFVGYIVKRFGRQGLLSILGHMKDGQDVDTAFATALSQRLDLLETQWHHSIRNLSAWFSYLSYYLYEIVFGLLALMCIYAFIKIMLKKRAYTEEDADGDLPP